MKYLNNFFLIEKYLLLIPIIILKLFNLSKKDKRPSYYKSSIIDNVCALCSPCDYIIDNIYLGSCSGCSDFNLLKNKNIHYICNISDNIPNFFEERLEYFNIKIKDNGIDFFTLDELEKSYDFIIKTQNKKKNILVHCFVGRSRSVTVLIYYLMKKYNFTIKESIIYLKNKRFYINPSINFISNIQNIIKDGNKHFH